MIKYAIVGAVHATAICLIWMGIDAIITALGGTPHPKHYWDVWFGAAVGAGNVYLCSKED